MFDEGVLMTLNEIYDYKIRKQLQKKVVSLEGEGGNDEEGG